MDEDKKLVQDFGKVLAELSGVPFKYLDLTNPPESAPPIDERINSAEIKGFMADIVKNHNEAKRD